MGSKNKENQPAVKKYLSPSQINTYLRCPEQYRRRYIKNEIIPPAIALLKGTSVHKASEKNFKQKIASRVDLPKQDIIDISVTTFEDTMKNEGLFLNKEEEDRGKAVVVGEAKDSVVVFSSLYSAQVAPRYQPKEVEKDQLIELADAPFNLKGRVDLIDENEKIIDLKTGTKTRSQDDVDRDTQLTFYSMTYRAIHGCDPTGLVIEQVIDKKVPENKTFTTTRNMKDYEALINRINVVSLGIKKGVFPPATDGAWWCSPLRCGFWFTCPYVKK
jgi:RecB family exonuclease